MDQTPLLISIISFFHSSIGGSSTFQYSIGNLVVDITPLGWIKALQAIHAGGRFMSVDFTAGDMSAVATAFGIKSYRITTPEELDNALDTAFPYEGPVFLDVVSESEVAELPPVFSWQQATKTPSSAE